MYRAGHGYIGILNTLFRSFCEFPVTKSALERVCNTHVVAVKTSLSGFDVSHHVVATPCTSTTDV